MLRKQRSGSRAEALSSARDYRHLVLQKIGRCARRTGRRAQPNAATARVDVTVAPARRFAAG